MIYGRQDHFFDGILFLTNLEGMRNPRNCSKTVNSQGFQGHVEVLSKSSKLVVSSTETLVTMLVFQGFGGQSTFLL